MNVMQGSHLATNHDEINNPIMVKITKCKLWLAPKLRTIKFLILLGKIKLRKNKHKAHI